MSAHSHQLTLILVLFSGAATLAGCSDPSRPVSPTTHPLASPIPPSTDTPPAPPLSPTPPPSPVPTRIPSVGELEFPYESADAGNASLLAATTIVVTWTDAPPDAQRYDFYLTQEGTPGPILLGTDLDASDGTSVQWVVPEHLAASLSAIAYFADGSIRTSAPGLALYSGQALPNDVCTIRSRGVAVVDLFRERSVDSENFAYITPGTYQPVLGRTEDGWYWIDATGAYDMVTGQTASGMGWVSDRSAMGLFGPCSDVPLIK